MTMGQYVELQQVEIPAMYICYNFGLGSAWRVVELALTHSTKEW